MIYERHDTAWTPEGDDGREEGTVWLAKANFLLLPNSLITRPTPARGLRLSPCILPACSGLVHRFLYEA